MVDGDRKTCFGISPQRAVFPNGAGPDIEEEKQCV
jgi:hypothetical protein